MVSYRREFLCEVVNEAEPLLQMHYDELATDKDRAALDPAWEEYAALEGMGRFHVFTAREDSRLVGYSAFFLNKHRHHGALVTATNDVLFLHPDQRRGRTGIDFIRFCEAQLKALGAQHIGWAAKPGTPLITILHRLGYATQEVLLTKFL